MQSVPGIPGETLRRVDLIAEVYPDPVRHFAVTGVSALDAVGGVVGESVGGRGGVIAAPIERIDDQLMSTRLQCQLRPPLIDVITADGRDVNWITVQKRSHGGCSIEHAVRLSLGHGVGRGVDAREGVRSGFPNHVRARGLPVAGEHAGASGDSGVISKDIGPRVVGAQSHDFLGQPPAQVRVGIAAGIGEIRADEGVTGEQAVGGKG